MQLPCFSVIAFTFFHLLITAQAMPSGGTSEGLEARWNSRRDTMLGAAVNEPEYVKSGIKQLQARQGLPVNVMQTSDASHPTLPVDNYKTDVSRLTAGEQ
ncbi:hypothetical protein C2E23DRAFT_890860 [Lenzites betulinus]|nr:hypothetical protein C2E23DRAFT_890860 [Lenzites betulinus]